jgi:hypothetical protein
VSNLQPQQERFPLPGKEKAYFYRKVASALKLVPAINLLLSNFKIIKKKSVYSCRQKYYTVFNF